MTKVYKFNNAQDMIDLAREIQINVYWGESFYREDTEVSYKYFWEHCDMALSEGFISVKKDDHNNITFLRE